MKIKNIAALLSIAAFFAVSDAQADGFFKKLVSDTAKAVIEESEAGKEYTQVRGLLDAVNEMPKDFSSFCKKYATRENFDKALSAVKSADVSACDQDVKTAKEEIVKSGEKVSETLAKMPAKTDFSDKNKILTAVAKSLAEENSTEKQFADELKDCLGQLNQSRAKLAEIAVKRFKALGK